MYVGIICACLPCLNAFVKRHFPNLFIFDPAVEQRISSFRISNRRARFGASGIHGDGTTTTAAAGGTTEDVLRSKPSKESNLDEEKSQGESSKPAGVQVSASHVE